MHVGFELFQPFLVHHAKALFLIDDDQAEAFELDRFRKHGMRADDDIQGAAGQRIAVALRLGIGN